MLEQILEITLQAEREKKEAIEFIEHFMELTEREKFHINGIMLGIKIAKYIQQKELPKEYQENFTSLFNWKEHQEMRR